MFTESLQLLARYNTWANEQFAQALATLSEEQFQKEILSSFPSIIKTIAHIHGAEDVWSQRLRNIHPTTFYKLPEATTGTAEVDQWRDSSRRLTDLILSFNEAELKEAIDYTTSRGDAWSNPRWQMIQYCVNHSSYHRGQLITLMRQVGVTSVPNTDLISYYSRLNAAV